MVGKQLTLRHTPQLHFKLDTTLEKGMALNALIKEAVADDRRRQTDADPSAAPEGDTPDANADKPVEGNASDGG